MPTLTPGDGDVLLLDLGDGENRFNPAWVAEVNACLDEVDGRAPAAVVTTASGKIWSNGLDLDALATLGDGLEGLEGFVAEVEALFARVLVSAVPMVAALQGHTFAAGAMLALAHDQRVMRSDRGFFCLPEVDIHIPFTPGMSALVQAKLSPPVAHEAMTTGKRYGGTDALAAGIVDEAVPLEQVLERAVQRAAEQTGRAGATLATIKQRMYAGALAHLRPA